MEPEIIATPGERTISVLQLDTPLSVFVPLKIGEKRDLIHFYFYPDNQKKAPAIRTQTVNVTRRALINGCEGYEVSSAVSKRYIIVEPDGYRMEVETTIGALRV